MFDAAVRAVDAREVTRRQISSLSKQFPTDRPIYALCIGKAANSMAVALDEVLGHRITAGLLTAQATANRIPSNWSYFASGHPLPNEESLRAAVAALEILKKANAEHATVLFAISGGGSAMLESPVSNDISLVDLQEANRILVTSGASIAEINTVRRAFSMVKGGKLAALAPEANIVSLIISDTNRGDEANVASGPSLPPTDLTTSAMQIVERYALKSKLPSSILGAIEESTGVVAIKKSPSFVLADNRTAIEAAASEAKKLGFTPIVAEDMLEQPIEEGVQMLIQRVINEPARVCLISGGEFACRVRGDGIGGRNSETVLRCAIELGKIRSETPAVVLSGGTDGIDGNSPAAGAIADNETVARAVALELDPTAFLARSDSFTFFNQLGDAIITGPTGTNVRDIRILLSDILY